jgi:hypothetical protein
VFGATLAVVPAFAHAHAILEDSQPPSGGSVPAGNVPLRFQFDSRVDHARSRLTLTHPDRTQHVLPIDPDGQPTSSRRMSN